VVGVSFIDINRLIAHPVESLVGLAIVGPGSPAYYGWVRATRRRSLAPQPT